MNELLIKVLHTIDKNNMISPNETVIAAVSGGHDSLCMLYVLNELKRLRNFELCVAHVNHSFRDTADDDQNFVNKTASDLGLKSYCIKKNVLEYSKENKISFETAGREIRYSFFNELTKKIPNSKIATAHNANDSIESFLMHLMRGSGLGGLTGIKPVLNTILRPMIDISRVEIEKYCSDNNLTPQIDITNLSDDYTRNDIRHNVIPHILDRCSVDTLTRTMSILTADNEFIEEYISQIAHEYIIYGQENKIINLKEFNKLSIAVKRRLIRLAIPKGEKQIGVLHIDSIINIVQNNYGGKYVILPNGFKVLLDKGILIINEVGNNDGCY